LRKRILSSLLLFYIFLSSLLLATQANEWRVLAAEENESWHFIALGDARNWEENSTNIIRKSITEYIINTDENFEFILNTGDMVNSGGEQDDWDRYYEDIALAVDKNITFYYTVGNHDIYTYRLPDGSYGPQEYNFSTYMANVEMPGNERYYSFNYKNRIHFIIINTDEFWDSGAADEFAITAEQKQWIIDDLSSNTLNFTIASFHRPAYSVRSTSRVEDAAEIRKVLEPIFLEYDVDLTFSGHDHYYYRTARQGVVYITTGGAGAPLYIPNRGELAQEDDEYFAEYHYCNITVSKEKTTIETMVFDETFESVSLKDNFTLDSNGEIIIEPEETTNPLTILPVTILLVAGLYMRRKQRNN